MQFSRDPAKGNEIKAYEPGLISINTEQYRSSLLLTADQLQALPNCHSIQDVNRALLEAVFALDVKVIILGCGEKQHFLPIELLALCNEKGIGIEIMPTAAACRTYNVLLAEERRVAAILILESKSL